MGRRAATRETKEQSERVRKYCELAWRGVTEKNPRTDKTCADGSGGVEKETAVVLDNTLRRKRRQQLTARDSQAI
uniref:Uncharacterized protein n=1 Tax=Angiostrongylus cantonensis TaxID=6313 RepID=A0A0K0D2H3_ANGCA